MKKKKKYILIISIILFLLFLAWYVSSYWIQLMLIQGDSMKPTYKNLQIVFVDKHTNTYKTDDVIVFYKDGIKGALVKRVVATEGDVVHIKEGILYINGKKSTCQLEDKSIDYAGAAAEEIVVPDNSFFVLGDNYRESKDSRYEEIGFVSNDDIVGKIID